MEKPELIENINWSVFQNDDQIESALKQCVREVIISSPKEFSREDVTKNIIDHIEAKGFSTGVTVTVSDPDEVGQRMVMGMAHSPLTGETISF